jgi:hypothetical protein
MGEGARNAEAGRDRSDRRQRGGAACAQRREAAGAAARGKAAAALLADLAEARRAERLVASLLAEVRDDLAARVIHAKDAGVGYDRMAQHTLRAVHRSTVTLLERRREAVRLRKLVHRRRRVTAGHGYPPAAVRRRNSVRDGESQRIRRHVFFRARPRRSSSQGWPSGYRTPLAQLLLILCRDDP